ncbi:MAG: DUF6790 family protein [Xanthobacteraceae bacterium]
MYFLTVILLLFVFPVVSLGAELLWDHGAADAIPLVGKWFVFWAVGVRLFIAGVRQVLAPQFTAESIFAIKDRAALPIVREVGFGNLAMGALGLASLARPDWLVPAAIVGGLYYGLAGGGHVLRRARDFNSRVAMLSDLAMLAVLGVFVASRFW